MKMFRLIGAALIAAPLACSGSQQRISPAPGSDARVSISAIGDSDHASGDGTGVPAKAAASATGGGGSRTPNELGRIPVLEYHIIGGKEALFTRSAEGFRRDIDLLYERGYRPVSISDVVDHKLDLPVGLSPVVFTFDDASPGQFRYVERNGKRTLDDTSAMGIWQAMRRKHPDWSSRATFCLLPAAKEGHAFFGEKGIEGQKSEWRFEKLRSLVDAGFELCGHTLWHARLDRYPDAMVQEQIARGVLAIDSAVPGYVVRSFALPLGIWPRRRDLASRGTWHDAKSGRDVKYAFDAVLMVAGGASRSPYDTAFDARKIPRSIVTEQSIISLLDHLDAQGNRYVSDGDPRTVAHPLPTVASGKPETPLPGAGTRSSTIAHGERRAGKGSRGASRPVDR